MATLNYKVYSGTMYNRNPRITLSNRLLSECGFRAGSNIEVTYEDGKITIRLLGNVSAQIETAPESEECKKCRLAKYCIAYNPAKCGLKRNEETKC